MPICIRWRLPVENFPQHKSRGKSALLQKRKQLTSEKAYLSKDKPCILKKRLNGVLDQNAGLIIQRFPRYFRSKISEATNQTYKNLGNHASSFRPMFVPQTDTYFDTLSVRKEKAGKCDYDFTANSIFYCRS